MHAQGSSEPVREVSTFQPCITQIQLPIFYALAITPICTKVAFLSLFCLKTTLSEIHLLFSVNSWHVELFTPSLCCAFSCWLLCFLSSLLKGGKTPLLFGSCAQFASDCSASKHASPSSFILLQAFLNFVLRFQLYWWIYCAEAEREGSNGTEKRQQRHLQFFSPQQSSLLQEFWYYLWITPSVRHTTGKWTHGHKASLLFLLSQL